MTRVVVCLSMAVLLHVPGFGWHAAEVARYLAEAGLS